MHETLYLMDHGMLLVNGRRSALMDMQWGWEGIKCADDKSEEQQMTLGQNGWIVQLTWQSVP